MLALQPTSSVLSFSLLFCVLFCARTTAAFIARMKIFVVQGKLNSCDSMLPAKSIKFNSRLLMTLCLQLC